MGIIFVEGDICPNYRSDITESVAPVYNFISKGIPCTRIEILIGLRPGVIIYFMPTGNFTATNVFIAFRGVLFVFFALQRGILTECDAFFLHLRKASAKSGHTRLP